MNKKEIIEEHNDWYESFGYCVFNSIINNKIYVKHNFVYDFKYTINDFKYKIKNNEYVEINLICDDCNFKHSAVIEFINKGMFHYVLLCEIKNFFEKFNYLMNPGGLIRKEKKWKRKRKNQ